MVYTFALAEEIQTDVHHVAHTYANPIVVSVWSATGRAYTMLRQTDWCFSGICLLEKDRCWSFCPINFG